SLGDQNGPERVVDLIDDLLRPEGRVGRETAPPAKRRPADPIELVDTVESTCFQRDGFPGRAIETGQAVKAQLLAHPEVEPAFAAIPVTVEDHGVLLADAKPTLGIQPGLDVQRTP